MKRSFMASRDWSVASELGYGRKRILSNSLSLKDLQHRQAKNPHVEPKAAMINVPDVENELHFPSEFVSTVDLSPSSHSGLYFVPTASRCVAGRQIFVQE